MTLRVVHGFASSTAVHQVAEETQRASKALTVLYVGDWDPSGMHMSDVDLPSRLTRYDGDAQLIRLALTAADLPQLPSFSECESLASILRTRPGISDQVSKCPEAH